MVSPDHEARVGSHRICSVVLVPSSVCPSTAFTRQYLTNCDLELTLSRSVSALSSSAALFEKIRKETIFEQADETLIDMDAKSKEQSLMARLKSSYSKKNITTKRHSVHSWGSTENEVKGVSLKLKNRQIGLLLSSIWVQAISNLNAPANYEAIANTYSLVMLSSRNKKSKYDFLVQGFQLALSLRSLSLQGGPLQPSRHRSLFILATSMIIFLSKAYNIFPLAASAKAALRDDISDPFLQLTDDCKLKASDDKIVVDDMVKVYGSKQDDEDAIKLLSTMKITDEQSAEAFASIILENLGKLSDAEVSNIKEHLLKDFVPDDICPLGAQIVTETPGRFHQMETKEVYDEAEPSMFSTSGDCPDSLASQTDSNSLLTMESPSLLSVDQFMDMVSLTSKEVGQDSTAAPSVLPFKDMASQCEALQVGKQHVISNFMTPPRLEDSSASLCLEDSTEAPQKWQLSGSTASSSGFPMQCGAGLQHNHDVFSLPASSPYDNFLKAAGS